MTQKSILEMSDDEVMGMTSAPEAPPVEEPKEPVEPVEEVETPASTPPVESVEEVTPEVVPPKEKEPEEVSPLATDDNDETKVPKKEPKAKEVVPPKEKEPAKTEVVSPKEEPAKKDVPPKAPETVETPINYEEAYKKIMQPFKANGREITLQNPEEAIRMMQMGANYTKKMQQLQPALRVITMLSNNQLMDEGKVSYFIDLMKGDQNAIQKLLADSKFDAMEQDSAKADSYVPGNHQVSDQELQFNQILDEAAASEHGAELISEMSRQWDKDSKMALYQEPALIRVLTEQKANGLYATITNEMHRQQVLGHLQGVPFLQAYKMVGDHLHAAGLLKPKSPAAPSAPLAPVQPEPVETRVVAPPAVVTNNERATAAAPPRTTAKAPAQEINYLAQSDDDFLKQMSGRV